LFWTLEEERICSWLAAAQQDLDHCSQFGASAFLRWGSMLDTRWMLPLFLDEDHEKDEIFHQTYSIQFLSDDLFWTSRIDPQQKILNVASPEPSKLDAQRTQHTPDGTS
jgi:hypothetical protein